MMLVSHSKEKKKILVMRKQRFQSSTFSVDGCHSIIFHLSKFMIIIDLLKVNLMHS